MARHVEHEQIRRPHPLGHRLQFLADASGAGLLINQHHRGRHLGGGGAASGRERGAEGAGIVGGEAHAAAQGSIAIVGDAHRQQMEGGGFATGHPLHIEPHRQRRHTAAAVGEQL